MGPAVEQKILDIKERVRASGKHIGIIAGTKAKVLKRQERGFRILCLGYDTGFLLTGMRSRLAELGRQVVLSPSFNPLFK